MASAIYAIVNQATRDMYVGSAVSVNRRWNAHRCNLRKRSHHCKHLQNAYAKYGGDAFDWEIIEFVSDKTKLIEREQFWLDFFQPIYNKRKIADSCFGVKRSEESRQKMSAAQIGRTQSLETIAKRSAALKGKPRSLDVRAKISASHIGIVPNEETRAKMSESAKRRKRK
jgi:group I intron endonuclease